MPDGREALSVRVLPRLAEVAAADWDACAGAANPFLSHAFLDALEESGSAVPEEGWLPRHLVLEDAGGRVLAAAPCYLKSHSLGEYVFDHGWAAAYEGAGGRYYPKLQSCVPFTPVPGRRLLVRPDAGLGAAEAEAALVGAMEEATRRLEASSAHVTFLDPAQVPAFEDAGWLIRTGIQFHWANRGYRDFDDFLADLTAQRRKAVRKERREAAASGVTVHMLTGESIRPEHWDAFHRFYLATSDRKWGDPYLTRECFHLIGERMADRVLLVMAERGGEWVAGALNLVGEDALFGRYWGCVEDHPCLHFELCYYRALDFAIERGLSRVEAGAQGPHKIRRGYLPVTTWSAHHIRDPGLRGPVAEFLARERTQVAYEIEALRRHTPFRRSRQDGPAAPGAPGAAP